MKLTVKDLRYVIEKRFKKEKDLLSTDCYVVFNYKVVEDAANNDGSRRITKTTGNSSTASMLNGAKQTARQFFQKLGPSFI
jgi:hypothetical protein